LFLYINIKKYIYYFNILKKNLKKINPTTISKLLKQQLLSTAAATTTNAYSNGMGES
jgi:hypothetical protein